MFPTIYHKWSSRLHTKHPNTHHPHSTIDNILLYCFHHLFMQISFHQSLHDGSVYFLWYFLLFSLLDHILDSDLVEAFLWQPCLKVRFPISGKYSHFTLIMSAMCGYYFMYLHLISPHQWF